MIPVILSGGSGTRLWPVSRATFPKQFIPLMGEPLFAQTVRRLQKFGSPWCVTLETMAALTQREFGQAGLPLEQIILEPAARNTAPAVALVCKILEMQGRQREVVGIFPADHRVEKDEVFEQVVRFGEQCAQGGNVVTLGIRPSYAATGFGYIEIENTLMAREGDLSAYRASGFREKPTLQTAEEFLQAGRFFWNAGIFLFQSSKLIEHFQTWMPELWKSLESLKSDLSNLKEIYPQLPSESFDYGIMEKMREHVCIPCEIGWSDVGSWDEVFKLHRGAPVWEEKARANQAWSMGRDKTFAFVGVDDLMVVESDDAVLIAKKGMSQHVRGIVNQLESQGSSVTASHPFEIRPWGRFEILRDTDKFKSKLIEVLAGHQISYQSHQKRSEHWVIVEGRAEVTLDDHLLPLKTGDSIFIKQGSKHRIRNPGPDLLRFIEVQTGTYFGEDDITRYSDDYGRN